jgi:hypothetical protein
MAGIEEDARQAIREIQEESPGRSRLSETTRRRLMKAGLAVGIAGYLVPAMRRLATADGQLNVSPVPVNLTKTMAIVSQCEINGVIIFSNHTGKMITIVSVVDTLVGIADQAVTFGSGSGSRCSIRLQSGAGVPPYQCASVPYTITFNSRSFSGDIITNQAVVIYRIENQQDMQKVETFNSLEWRCGS